MKTHSIAKKLTVSMTLSSQEALFIAMLLEHSGFSQGPPDHLRGILSLEDFHELVRDFRSLRHEMSSQ